MSNLMMITPFYAALLAILYLGLTVRTIRLRQRLRISVGSNDNQEMLRAMRVHSNFAEYAPLGCLLALMIELQQGYDWLVHLVCGLLLVGRVLHAFGVSQVNENFRYRISGMVATLTSIAVSAASLLTISLSYAF